MDHAEPAATEEETKVADKIDPVFITGEEAERIRAMGPRAGKPNVSAALRSGQVVFLPGKTSANNGSFHTSLRAYGMRPRWRAGERDGVAGMFVWAEKAQP